jgi:hypothetical protein
MSDLPPENDSTDPDDLRQFEETPEWERAEEFNLIADSSFGQQLQESCTPRIYVTFHRNVAKDPVDEKKITIGPYLSVQMDDDMMNVVVAGEDEDTGLTDVCVATREDAGWKVHDGLEESSPFFDWIEFHTVVWPLRQPPHEEPRP